MLIKKEDDFYTNLKHFNTFTISWEDFIGGFWTNQIREILSEQEKRIQNKQKNLIIAIAQTNGLAN